jgi:hypothetical protein
MIMKANTARVGGYSNEPPPQGESTCNSGLDHELIKIEKGIPLLDRIRGRRDRYPYKQMKVGDSFFVQNMNSKSLCSVSNYAAKHLGYKFIHRATNQGTRCWRVA